MADETPKTGAMTGDSLTDSAERVLENLAELEPELVSAGIFGPDRIPIALTGGSEGWSKTAAQLLDALDAASGDEVIDSAQVASTDGEVFVVIESGLSLVAVTGRFVLASLTSYDMRMALRDVATVRSNRLGSEPSSEAEKSGSDDA